MKNIAIFASGEGEATYRIVNLFNEGNRLKTVMVVADDSALPLIERLRNHADISLIHVPDEEWHQKGEELGNMLREKNVSLIVLDDFRLALADEILEATEGEMIRVTSAEQAPREVVAALEKDLRKPREEEVKEEEPVEDEEPSMEHEWAKALKIQYTPPKIPTTPPEVPQEPPVVGVPPEIPEQQKPSPEITGYEIRPPYYPNGPQNNPYYPHGHHQHPNHEEPMPSTWLIWSILVTVFCCFIPGIVAIIFSSQVSAKYYAGDIEGAKRSSRTAEIWIIVSVVLGIVSATLYLPFMLLGN